MLCARTVGGAGRVRIDRSEHLQTPDVNRTMRRVPVCLRGMPVLQWIALAGVITTLLAAFPATAESIDMEFSAESLLDRARAHRETLSPDFPGFRSRLVAFKDGTQGEGTMLFRPPITLEIEIGDADLRKAVKRTVRSLLAHRLPHSPSGKTVDRQITYAKEDQHPLGRRIFLGDKYVSSYRIRDNRILEVDRYMDDEHLVITVMKTEETVFGRHLPNQFFVALFDRDTGRIKQSSAYTDAYRRVGNNYLPESRQIVSTADGRTEILLITWKEMELLSPVMPN